MNKKVENIILCCVAVLAVAVVVVLYICGARRQSGMECGGVRVNVTDSKVNKFVSEGDVKKIVSTNYGDITGVFADSIDLVSMERLLEKKSVIRDCEAYFTRDGFLNIDITQRTPVVRFQNAANGWYADADGYIFPLQRSYTSMVQVVDGDFPIDVERGFKGQIEDTGQREWLMRVVGMAEYIRGSEWKNRISQIHVSGNGEVLLVPSEGKERFIFGQPVEIETKFGKMEKYYRMILPLKKEYRQVDLRFNGQIVCR